MNDKKKGVLRAEVVTATSLSDAYYARLQQQLEKMTGRKVAIDKREDPSHPRRRRRAHRRHASTTAR